MVEFALIVPLLALITLGVIDLGRVFYTYEAVANAAREGARFCALHANGVSNPFGRVAEELGGQVAIEPDDVAVNVNGTSRAACPGPGDRGSPVTVTVSPHFGLITPFVAKILDPNPTCAAPPPGDPILRKLRGCSEVNDRGERGFRITASATMVVW
jgi:hypothetical protein